MDKTTFTKSAAKYNELQIAGGQAALDAAMIRDAENVRTIGPLSSSQARAFTTKHGGAWSADYRALVAYEVFYG